MSSTPAPRPRVRCRRWWRDSLLVLFVFASLLAGWYWLSPASSPIHYLFTTEALPAVPREPRPATLDPALIPPPWKEGYRIARERPEVLERLACYCGCYWSQGHQNALDCFRDRHAEGCPLCLRMAQRAEQLDRAGYSFEEIKRLTDREFSSSR